MRVHDPIIQSIVNDDPSTPQQPIHSPREKHHPWLQSSRSAQVPLMPLIVTAVLVSQRGNLGDVGATNFGMDGNMVGISWEYQMDSFRKLGVPQIILVLMGSSLIKHQVIGDPPIRNPHMMTPEHWPFADDKNEDLAAKQTVIFSMATYYVKLLEGEIVTPKKIDK